MVFSANDNMAHTITQTLSLEGHDEQPIVSFHFISDLPRYEEEKLFEIWQETEPNVPKSNCEFEKLDGIKLKNMRTADIRCDYDTTGFKYLHAPSMAALRGVDCVENEESLPLNAYLDEIISLIKAQFDTDQVICFDWRVSLPIAFRISKADMYRSKYRKSTGKKQINVYDHTKAERVNALNPAHVVHFGMHDPPNQGSRLRSCSTS